MCLRPSQAAATEYLASGRAAGLVEVQVEDGLKALRRRNRHFMPLKLDARTSKDPYCRQAWRLSSTTAACSKVGRAVGPSSLGTHRCSVHAIRNLAKRRKPAALRIGSDHATPNTEPPTTMPRPFASLALLLALLYTTNAAPTPVVTVPYAAWREAGCTATRDEAAECLAPSTSRRP